MSIILGLIGLILIFMIIHVVIVTMWTLMKFTLSLVLFPFRLLIATICHPIKTLLVIGIIYTAIGFIF